MQTTFRYRLAVKSGKDFVFYQFRIDQSNYGLDIYDCYSDVVCRWRVNFKKPVSDIYFLNS